MSEARSYQVEVRGGELKTEWEPSLFLFPDQEQARGYGRRLLQEWALVDEFRVVPSQEEPTNTFEGGKVISMGEGK